MFIDEDIQILKEYVSSHRPLCFRDMSEYARAIIISDVEFISQNFNPEKIWLLGSYARGTEISPETPEHIKRHMSTHFNKNKESDRDYYIYPPINTIHCFKDPYINIMPFKPNYAIRIM